MTIKQLRASSLAFWDDMMIIAAKRFKEAILAGIQEYMQPHTTVLNNIKTKEDEELDKQVRESGIMEFTTSEP